MNRRDDAPQWPPRRALALFFVLACAITWAFDAPLAIAWIRHVPPAPWALPLTGLGALGPLIAAAICAARTRTWRDTFGRWRTSPVWIVVGLLLPLAMHLPATLIDVALGGEPARWVYYPQAPERIAALLMFPLGEEFGWRGFAQPRAGARFGAVRGAMIVGAVWGLWHLGMTATPDDGAPTPFVVARFVVELALLAIVFAWLWEKSGRSIAAALAAHVGLHLDNVSLTPVGEVRIQVLRFAVLVVVAALCARALSTMERRGSS